MIIQMMETDLNRRAAEAMQQGKAKQGIQYYPQIDLSDVRDEELTIIDLEADGEFQKKLSPERFAAFLVKKRLGSTVKKINLIVSDVYPFESALFTFAAECHQALLALEKNISVCVVSDLNQALTLVCPPDHLNKKWQVFGVSSANYMADIAGKKLSTTTESKEVKSKEALNHAFYKGYQKKTLLWEGADLLDWLNKAERTFRSEIELKVNGLSR